MAYLLINVNSLNTLIAQVISLILYTWNPAQCNVLQMLLLIATGGFKIQLVCNFLFLHSSLR